MIDYRKTDINHALDDLFVSVNDIYEQYDEGKINYIETLGIMNRICNHFIKVTNNED